MMGTWVFMMLMLGLMVLGGILFLCGAIFFAVYLIQKALKKKPKKWKVILGAVMMGLSLPICGFAVGWMGFVSTQNDSQPTPQTEGLIYWDRPGSRFSYQGKKYVNDYAMSEQSGVVWRRNVYVTKDVVLGEPVVNIMDVPHPFTDAIFGKEKPEALYPIEGTDFLTTGKGRSFFIPEESFQTAWKYFRNVENYDVQIYEGGSSYLDHWYLRDIHSGILEDAMPWDDSFLPTGEKSQKFEIPLGLDWVKLVGFSHNGLMAWEVNDLILIDQKLYTIKSVDDDEEKVRQTQGGRKYVELICSPADPDLLPLLAPYFEGADIGENQGVGLP